MRKLMRHIGFLRAAIAALSGALLMTCAVARPAAGAGYTNTIALSAAHITNVMAQHNIPGLTIVLVESNDVVWAEGFGYADTEQRTPVTTNTVMMIGSVSKMLTALMALQLVDDGAFDLDAGITDYIPEFSMLPRFAGQADAWTLRAMLDHHSGIPGDIFNGGFVHGPYWPGYTQWMIGYFQDDYPLYPPRLFASYCNSGFNLLGEAIGRHDGVDFTVAAENRLFTPLDMPYTSFLADKATIRANLATGYYADGTPAPLTLANFPATGGAFSRPLDMAQIIKMLLAGGRAGGGQFISTNALAQFGRANPGPLDIDTYFVTGLGLDTVDDPVLNYAGRTWAKNGSTGFFEALFEVLPDQQLGVFASINCANNMTLDVVREVLINAVREKSGIERPPAPPMPTPAETSLPYAELQAIEGHYVTKSGVDLFQAQTDGSLSCVPNAHQGAAAVTNYRPHANGRFFVPGRPELQLGFTNIAGYDVLIRYGNDGTLKSRLMYGEYGEYVYGTRYTPPPVSSTWSNRCGTTWVADNLIYSDLFLAQGYAGGYTLSVSNGILFLDGNSIAILSPADDRRAFAAGLSSRGDSCVRIETDAEGRETLWFGGYRCARMEDIPVLTNRGVAEVEISMHTNALLMYSNGAPGRTATAQLSSNAAQAFVRVIDPDSMSVTACGTGSVAWTSGGGPVILHLSASNTLTCAVTAMDYTTPTGDYNGDGLADMAVYDVLTGTWHIRDIYGNPIVEAALFGGPGFVPVPGDYTGDGVNDFAVYGASSGLWHVGALDGTTIACGEQWGGPGFIPVAGDYDGDGIYDMAVYDLFTGNWFIASLSSRFKVQSSRSNVEIPTQTLNFELEPLNRSAAAESPIADRRSPNTSPLSPNTDLSDVVALTKSEYCTLNTGSSRVIAWAVPWGGPTMLPVPGDYDKNGFHDLAVYEQSSGNWHITGLHAMGSTHQSPNLKSMTATAARFGGPGFAHVSGDYDGDGAHDLAVYHQSSGLWYIASLTSVQSSVSSIQTSKFPNTDNRKPNTSSPAHGSLNTEHCTLNTGSPRVIAWAEHWGGPGLAPLSGDYTGDGKSDLAVYGMATGQWFIRTLDGTFVMNGAQWGGNGFLPVLEADAPSRPAGLTPVYRVYNYGHKSGTFEHFFTANRAEAEHLVSTPHWIDEGIAWYALTSGTGDALPLYRGYSKISKAHYYTLDASVYNTLTSLGWVGEGVSMFAWATAAAGRTAVYQFHNAGISKFLLTADENEKNALLADPVYGYAYQGIAFYAYSQPQL